MTLLGKAKIIAGLMAIVALPFAGAALSYRSRSIELQFVEHEHTFSAAEKEAIEQVAAGAARDVRVHLPSLPETWKLVVTTGSNVIAETGENGTWVAPNEIVWTMDPSRDIAATIRTQLRATLFHELHHLVRAQRVSTPSLLDAVVTEGLATAFERDFGNTAPPWADIPVEIEAWTAEVLALPANAPRNDWLILHPDGRRWVGMLVGTFIVDRATKLTGRSAAALAHATTDDIVRASRLRDTPK